MCILWHTYPMRTSLMCILPTVEKIIDSLKITSQGISSKEYDECASNGNVNPCIGENGGIVYYCDDQKVNILEMQMQGCKF